MPVSAWAQWLSPLFAFVVFGIIVLAMRWTFSRSRRRVSTTIHDRPENYGLLVPITQCRSRGEADATVLYLASHGLRASAVETSDGPYVMVFPGEVNRAVAALEQRDAG